VAGHWFSRGYPLFTVRWGATGHKAHSRNGKIIESSGNYKEYEIKDSFCYSKCIMPIMRTGWPALVGRTIHGQGGPAVRSCAWVGLFFTCALLEALRWQATQPFLSYAGMHALARLSQAPGGLPRRVASLTRYAAVSPPRTDSPSSLALPSTPMDPQVSGDSRAMEGAHASARHASSRIIIVPVGRWSSLPDLGTRRTDTVPVGPETG
jgi:hypothetical protein